MNQNSVQIYYSKVLPDIKKKHERVFNALLSLGGEATVYEVAERLNTPVHAISGRLTELSSYSEYGLPIIKENGKRNNKYGNPCIIWKIVERLPVGEQAKMF